MKITAAQKGLIVMAMIMLSGCNRWQIRADELQNSIDQLVTSGHKSKDDFMRQFGVPASCAPLTTGELCQWNTELGYQGSGYTNRQGYTVSSASKVVEEIRVEFDKADNFVKGTALVQRGSRMYQGGKDSDISSSDSSPSPFTCPTGEVSQSGRCYATSPGGGPPN